MWKQSLFHSRLLLYLNDMKRSLLISLLLLVLAAPLLGDSRPNLPLVSTTRVVLSNGLTILVRERHDVNNVGIQLLTGAGQVTEDESQTGITHLLVNYLLEMPVHGFHDGATAIESQGGIVSASSGPDSSEINMDVTSQEFPFAVKVLSELIHVQKINSGVFQEVKENVLSEIHRQGEESYQSLYNLFLQEFYSFHPYRVPVVGAASSIKNLKPQDLLNYYNHYVVPNNIVIAVVGNVDVDRTLKLVSHYFSDLTKRQLKPKDIYYQPIIEEQKQIQLQENGGISWLFVGFSAPEFKSDDYPAMEVINSILGASMSSRIWLSIREKRGLSYQLGSQYSFREGPSHFVIYVATSPENLGESRRQLLHEVERVRQEPLTPAEMEITKRRLMGHFILGLETNIAQAQFLAHSELYGKGILYNETYIHLIEQLTSEDIQRVAKKYLNNYILISVE